MGKEKFSKRSSDREINQSSETSSKVNSEASSKTISEANRNFCTGEIILHIPHSSTHIPETYRPLFFADDKGLQEELLRTTDLYTDELFDIPEVPEKNRIVFPISPLVCDVERNRDDTRELMAKVGMGVCHTLDSCGKPLKGISEAYIREMYENYDWHHQKLEEAADGVMTEYGRAILIDCHSISSEPLPYEQSGPFKNRRMETPRADISIGQDFNLHTPEWLKLYFLNAFSRKGYSIAVDSPFSETMVPMKYYHRDLRLHSVMIKVRRGLYMDEKTGTKTAAYDKIKKDIRDAVLGLAKLPPEKRKNKMVPEHGQALIAYESYHELKEILDYLDGRGYANCHHLTAENRWGWFPRIIVVNPDGYFATNVTCMAPFSAKGWRACTLYEFQTKYEKLMQDYRPEPPEEEEFSEEYPEYE